MEFMANPGFTPENLRVDNREFIAVPTDPSGAFVIDHGEHYGSRVYRVMALHVAEDELEYAREGNFGFAEDSIALATGQNGILEVASGLCSVGITHPGSDNTTHFPVTQVQELSPVVQQSRTRNWTVDPVTGRSNSSTDFVYLKSFVEELLRKDIRSSDPARYPMIAQLIVAQLAHVKGMRPAPKGYARES